MNQQAVQNLAKHWHSDGPGGVTNSPVIIAAHPVLDVKARQGDLVRVSPQETVHAFIFACADVCRSGATASELDQWRKAMLSTTFRFETILTREDLYWRAANLWELVVSEFRAVALSPVQRVCQVMEFKTAYESSHGGVKLSAASLAQHFLDNLRMAEDCEKLSKNLVDNILTVWTRALSKPAVLTVVLESEERFGSNSPFDSILKMHTIVTKASTPEAIVWVFVSLADLTRSGQLGQGSASLSALGHGSSRSVSLKVLMARKLLLRNLLVSTWLASLEVRQRFKDHLQAHFASHAAFRSAAGYPDPAKAKADHVDMSWRSDYSMGEMLLRAWAEELVFGTEYDAVIKQAIKVGKSPEAPQSIATCTHHSHHTCMLQVPCAGDLGLRSCWGDADRMPRQLGVREGRGQHGRPVRSDCCCGRGPRSGRSWRSGRWRSGC